MPYEGSDSGGAEQQVMDVAKSLRSAMEGFEKGRDDGATIDLRVKGDRTAKPGDDAGGSDGGSIAFQIELVINANTAADAEKCAKDFEDTGATCVSTGDTQVTCTYD